MSLKQQATVPVRDISILPLRLILKITKKSDLLRSIDIVTAKVKRIDIEPPTMLDTTF